MKIGNHIDSDVGRSVSDKVGIGNNFGLLVMLMLKLLVVVV